MVRLRKVGCVNVVKVSGSFDAASGVYLVSDTVGGGNLLYAVLTGLFVLVLYVANMA